MYSRIYLRLVIDIIEGLREIVISLPSTMLRIYKILLLIVLMGMTMLPFGASAGVQAIPGAGELSGVSMNTFGSDGDSTGEKVSSAAFKMLTTAKVILNGIAVIYIVYIGTMMIIAFGDDGELSKQKKQLMYALVAFLFVNIPGQIYNVFTFQESGADVNRLTQSVTSTTYTAKGSSNIFINLLQWDSTVEGGVIGFVRVAVIGLAVFYFTLAGFKLLVS